MPRSPTGPRAAYIEDYNEDAKTTLPETRQTANIAAKRSKPDIIKENNVVAIQDEFSDSGYSSRTGATLGSGDSSLDSKTGAAPVRVNADAAANKGRAGGSHHEQHRITHGLRRPTLRRTDSRAKEKGQAAQQECQCSLCKKGGYHAARSPEQLRSSKDMTGRPTTKATPPIAVPPRPQSTKPVPPRPTQEVPILQIPQARPRALTSQSYQRQRPISFHAGSLPQVTYQPVYVAQAQPSITVPSPLPPPSFPPPSYYAPATPIQESPYQNPVSVSPVQRRTPVRWHTDQPAPQRQSIVYSAAPVIEHAQPQYTTTLPSQPVSRRVSTHNGSSYHRRQEQYVPDEDYYRMPPPPAPPPKQPVQRPAIRHAATTSVAHTALYQHRNSRPDGEQALQPTPRSPVKTTAPVRETAHRPNITSRASGSSSNNSGPSAHAIERDMRHLSIESNSTAARKRRPYSYYGHESPQHLEQSVEAYQASAGIGTTFPLTEDSLNLVRKKTQTSSETGSRLSTHSKGSKRSSEGKARKSTDRSGSDIKTRDDADGLTMRFNASQAVNVDFKGSSVDGRTISLRPSKDGGGANMVLGIGGKSSGTNSRASLKEKGRKRYSYVESTGVREIEAAESVGRPSRGSKTRESSRAPEKRVAISRSRRSSKSGRV